MPNFQKQAGEMAFRGARTGDILATDEGIGIIAAALEATNRKAQERVIQKLRDCGEYLPGEVDGIADVIRQGEKKPCPCTMTTPCSSTCPCGSPVQSGICEVCFG